MTDIYIYYYYIGGRGMMRCIYAYDDRTKTREILIETFRETVGAARRI